MRLISMTAMAMFALALMAACGGGGGGAAAVDDVAAVEFVVQPSAGVYPSMIAVQVRLLDAEGNTYQGTKAVGLNLMDNPTGATLMGGGTQVVTNGVADFNVAPDRGGIGFTLIARTGVPPFKEVISAPFDFVGEATSLVVSSSSTAGIGTPVAGLQVRLVDAGGTTVMNDDRMVNLELVNNNGFIMFHASGLGDPILERVEPTIGPVYGPLAISGDPTTELLGMTWHPVNKTVYASDLAGQYFRIDPITGEHTMLNAAGISFRGLSYDPITGLVFGAARNTADFYTVVPTSGLEAYLGPIVDFNATDVIDKIFGMDYDPLTGYIYAICHIVGDPNKQRRLAEIDPDLLDAVIGDPIGIDGATGFAFSPDGVPYLLTGDGSSNPESAYLVTDLLAGTVSLLGPLGLGDDGESLCAVPPQLMGTLQAMTVNGIATFPNVLFEASGVDYRIKASAAGVSDGQSLPITVGP